MRGGRTAEHEACRVRQGGRRRPSRRARVDVDDGKLTPALVEMIERTFRGVHLLAYLKHEELAALGRQEDFRRATEAGQIAQAETLNREEADEET